MCLEKGCINEKSTEIRNSLSESVTVLVDPLRSTGR